MAPKRGHCYKCDKFQTHIRRHVKTCKSSSPNRKRRVTAGNSLIGNDFNKRFNVTGSNSLEFDVTARNIIKPIMISENDTICID